MSASRVVYTVRVILPILTCGFVGFALHASVTAGPKQAAASTTKVESAAVTTEPADMPRAFTPQSQGFPSGIDARQDAALAVLLVLAVAARSDGERRGARQRPHEVGQLGAGVSRPAP